jgi:RNA polymerase sigma-70 factor (ECF subfamily)
MTRLARKHAMGSLAMREDELRAMMMSGLSGDARAHADLLRALAPLLLSFYSRRCDRAAGDVEDLVQETLIAVHERRATYDVHRPFTAWLFAIARYKMIDHFRRRRATCDIADLDHILMEEGFEDAVSARMDVAQLLTTLPAKQAEAIRATRIEGRSVAEHADAAGIGESDVKISVHRGLKALALRLRGER